MEIAPDFYSYFQAALPLLEVDRTVWAVSSWNDNGQAQFVGEPRELVRADFFPGLGWGTSKRIWRELKRKWPGGYWDDWMREPPQRLGRVTIRPDISRTRNFGAHGASDGLFFDQYIASNKLNEQAVDWAAENLNYLVKANYDRFFFPAVHQATVITKLDQIRTSGGQDYRIQYSSLQQYEGMAERNGLMSDSKAGVPRGGYRDVVLIRYRGNRVFYTPSLDRIPQG